MKTKPVYRSIRKIPYRRGRGFALKGGADIVKLHIAYDFDLSNGDSLRLST